MKTISKILLLLLCCQVTNPVFSQRTDNSKKAIFAAYPNSISLSKNTLQQTFSAIPGETINVAFSDQFIYNGTVMSNEVKYANLQSVIIKSAAFGNALFQLSKITNDDNSIAYVGRIINQDVSDGYEIKRDSNDNYRFQKFQTDKILQDCSY